MSELESRELRDNIVDGLNRSFQKLVQEKQREDSELAIADKGHVITVKASEI